MGLFSMHPDFFAIFLSSIGFAKGNFASMLYTKVGFYELAISFF